MKTLVIGASGQVGNQIYYNHFINGDHVQGTYHSIPLADLVKLDVSDRAAVIAAVNCFQPEVIYLPGSQTNVDVCEIYPTLTRQTNVNGPKNIVDAISGSDCKLIYYSSDYVFNGVEGFYTEEDPINPINEYGRQKAAAEHYIIGKCSNYIILRTNVVFGKDQQKKNFVIRLIDNLKVGANHQIPNDEYGSPTYNADLANVSIGLAANNVKNTIINVSGPNLMSRYKFAQMVTKVFELDDRLVSPCQSVDLKRAALRPLNAGLDCSKLNRLGYQISSCWDSLVGLKKMEKK